MSPPAARRRREPARVGVISPQPVVAAGLHALLSQVPCGWQVVLGYDRTTPPDVVLYDVLLLHDGDGADLDHLVTAGSTVVIAVSRDLRPDLGAEALDRGAGAAISIGVSATEAADVVRAALDGTLHESAVARRHEPGVPLGRESGLSRRESDVLRLIVQGYSNQEIADRLFLSINSIKTYIRTAYRKIAVGNRQQAVTWAIQHGFPIERDEQDSPPDPPSSRGTLPASQPDGSHRRNGNSSFAVEEVRP